MVSQNQAPNFALITGAQTGYLAGGTTRTYGDYCDSGAHISFANKAGHVTLIQGDPQSSTADISRIDDLNLVTSDNPSYSNNGGLENVYSDSHSVYSGHEDQLGINFNSVVCSDDVTYAGLRFRTPQARTKVSLNGKTYDIGLFEL